MEPLKLHWPIEDYIKILNKILSPLPKFELLPGIQSTYFYPDDFTFWNKASTNVHDTVASPTKLRSQQIFFSCTGQTMNGE